MNNLGPSSNPSKPMKSSSNNGGHSIGMIPLIAFAVGTMVGGGVFALSGIVVKDAGPGAIIAYVLAGLVMVLSALCFAAVASRAQPGQTGYAPIGTTLSPMWRFVTMWAFYITGVTGVAFVLMSFGSYFMYFVPRTHAIYAALGAAVVLILLNFGPASAVAKTETILVGFKIAVLLVLILFGFIGFAPDAFKDWTPNGIESVFAATALLFSAYTGFNVITNMAGSVKNPQKKVPAAIIISLVFVALIYIGVAIALVVSGTSNEPNFQSQGLTLAAEKLMGHWGAILVAIAACVSTLSGANANLLGASDLLIHMAAQGDVPSKLGKLNKAGDAVRSVALSGAIIVALMLLGIIPSIGNKAMNLIVVFSNVSAIIAMVIVDITALKMAVKKWPTAGMKLPLGWLIPLLAVVAALAQLPALGWGKVAIGTSMVLLGFVVWAFRKKSDPKEVSDIKDHINRGDTPLLRAAGKLNKRNAGTDDTLQKSDSHN